MLLPAWLSGEALALAALVTLAALAGAALQRVRSRKACLPAAAPTRSQRAEILQLASASGETPRVRDIMSATPITLAPEDSAKIAWRKLQEHRVKTLPVVAAGQVVGIVALVDMLKHLGLAWHKLPDDINARAAIVMEQEVASLMSKPVRTVVDDMPLTDLVPLLSETGLRHLPVVNAEGNLVGIVTQSDLIAGLEHLLRQHTPE